MAARSNIVPHLLTLDFEMTYRFRTRGPLKSTAGAPTGEREYWEMAEGTLEGPRIRANIARRAELTTYPCEARSEVI